MMERKNYVQRWLAEKGFLKLSLVVALIAAFAVGSALGVTFHPASASTDSAASSNAAVGVVSNVPVNPTTSFAPIVKSALPAVVSISSTKITRVQNADEGLSPFFNDPRFRDFFGDQPPNRGNGKPREQRQQGLGSGVIISGDGYIITNNHVIEDASEIKVTFSDKHEVPAKLIGTDPNTDIAVLKVEEKGLPSLKLADSAQVQVGDVALAIGNPFGIGQTVTMGIISATGRGNLGIEDYEDFLQTDAAINPGNSGGALINTNGDLIGINTAILANGSRGNQGVGFAVPANMARQVMNQIMKQGKVVRAYMGVMIQPVTPEIAKAFNLNGTGGALIGQVTPNGPAAKAGIEAGDVITELNGLHVVDNRELRLNISQLAPGSTAKLKVVRDGKERELAITLGELPGNNKKAETDNSDDGSSSINGISVDNLTPQIAGQLGLPASASGVVISNVEEGSAAANAGLQEGDVIQSVNRKPVNSVAEFDSAVKQTAGKSMLLLVNQKGQTRFVVVETK